MTKKKITVFILDVDPTVIIMKLDAVIERRRNHNKFTNLYGD